MCKAVEPTDLGFKISHLLDYTLCSISGMSSLVLIVVTIRSSMHSRAKKSRLSKNKKTLSLYLLSLSLYNLLYCSLLVLQDSFSEREGLAVCLLLCYFSFGIVIGQFLHLLGISYLLYASVTNRRLLPFWAVSLAIFSVTFLLSLLPYLMEQDPFHCSKRSPYELHVTLVEAWLLVLPLLFTLTLSLLFFLLTHRHLPAGRAQTLLVAKIRAYFVLYFLIWCVVVPEQILVGISCTNFYFFLVVKALYTLMGAFNLIVWGRFEFCASKHDQAESEFTRELVESDLSSVDTPKADQKD